MACVSEFIVAVRIKSFPVLSAVPSKSEATWKVLARIVKRDTPSRVEHANLVA